MLRFRHNDVLSLFLKNDLSTTELLGLQVEFLHSFANCYAILQIVKAVITIDFLMGFAQLPYIGAITSQ